MDRPPVVFYNKYIQLQLGYYSDEIKIQPPEVLLHLHRGACRHGSIIWGKAALPLMDKCKTMGIESLGKRQK